MMVCLLSFNCFADEWSGEDKMLHLGVGAGVSLTTYTVCRGPLHWSKTKSFLTTLAVATLLNVGKELYDQSHGREFSYKDIAAGTAGNLVGVTIVVPIDWFQK